MRYFQHIKLGILTYPICRGRRSRRPENFFRRIPGGWYPSAIEVKFSEAYKIKPSVYPALACG